MTMLKNYASFVTVLAIALSTVQLPAAGFPAAGLDSQRHDKLSLGGVFWLEMLDNGSLCVGNSLVGKYFMIYRVEGLPPGTHYRLVQDAASGQYTIQTQPPLLSVCLKGAAQNISAAAACQVQWSQTSFNLPGCSAGCKIIVGGNANAKDEGWWVAMRPASGADVQVPKVRL